MSVVRKSCMAVVAVLLLGGCAEGDDELTGAQARVAEQANPICKETRLKVGDLGGDPTGERDAVQSAADRVKAIPVPGDEEPTYRVFQVQVQNLALNLEDLLQARARNETDRATRALERARESNEELKKAARSYGLTECSQGLAT